MSSGETEIELAIITTTVVFLLVALSIIFLVITYNRRKKMHIDEKARMTLSFEAELLKTKIEVQEQTMQSIAADLHDNIGQLLSLTSLTLGSVNIVDPEKAMKKIETARQLTSRSVKELRHLAKLLHGEHLLEMGLDEAIQYELNWLERSGNYQITYERDVQGMRPTTSQKGLILFRLVQEILNNIMKHSGASEIRVELYSKGGMLRLNITDNGVGFDVDDAGLHKTGMGLNNFRKRAEMIGGDINIASARGKGTTISITIPNF
jgi:two-component system, NarL family, sensor kinase